MPFQLNFSLNENRHCQKAFTKMEGRQKFSDQNDPAINWTQKIQSFPSPDIIFSVELKPLFPLSFSF